MLEQLYIENIAVIEKSSMEFYSGFNLLTGETGAGKSIIIDSINAVLGERTSRDLIRSGCDRANVSAVFSLNEKQSSLCSDAGFPPEDGTLVISRTMTADGKNICRVGGRPAPLSVLKELGHMLVNIHGQHDSQALLDSEQHYLYLDAVADNAKAREEYSTAFNKYKIIAKQLRTLDTDETEKAKRTELLEYQINELNLADISVGEKEKLKAKRNRLRNAEKLTEIIAAVIRTLKGDEDNAGAVEMVKSAAAQSTSAAEIDPMLSADSEKLTALAFDLEAAADEWDSRLEADSFNAAELNKVEERLDALYELGQKYGETEEEMLVYLEKAEQELRDITFSDRRKAELEEQLDAAQDELIQTAQVLTESRKIAGEKFSEAIKNELEFLNMPGVAFSVNIEKSKYDKTGADRVEFLISANIGEPPKPLAKIASGGELSRIMLAIKSVLAEKDEIETLIFDEIDTGISGRAARAVGIKLKQVSRGRQVICITHLAQIAAMADNHMLIEKQMKDGRTYTAVRQLIDNDRVDEIARIMSGGQLTESLEQTAKELIEYGKGI